MHVRILLATYQGERHLAAQLASFEAQAHADWSLTASDDGSTDATPAILRAFRDRHPGRVTLREGPRRGGAANFLSVLGAAGEGPPNQAVAFADQDDVWLPHHLAAAVARLGPDTTYACRTLLVRDDLSPIGSSRAPRVFPNFANALVKNVLAGNTLVLGAGAAATLRATLPAALPGDGWEGVPYHDWWAYLVGTGSGGRIALGEEPGLLYRQHGSNHLGAHRGLSAGLRRIGEVRRGAWGAWVGRNLRALHACERLLTPEARALVERLTALRAEPSALARLRLLGPLHRQTPAQQALLKAAALLGRL
jgi:hypothetical protein